MGNNIEFCYFCEKEFPKEEFSDSYDNIYYICKTCFEMKVDEWSILKEHWCEADYRWE